MSGEQLGSSGLGSVSCVGSVPGNWSGLGSPSVCASLPAYMCCIKSVSFFLWLKSSEKDQNKEEEKEESAWQVRACGFGINDGCVY